MYKMGLKNAPARKVRKLCNKVAEALNDANLTLESHIALRDWFLAMASECNKFVEIKKAERQEEQKNGHGKTDS